MAHQGDVLNLSNSWLLTKSTISSILLFTVLSGRGMCPTLLAAALPKSSRQMSFAAGRTNSCLMSNGTFLLLQHLSPTNTRPSVQQHYQTLQSLALVSYCFVFSKRSFFSIKAGCFVSKYVKYYSVFFNNTVTYLPTYLPIKHFKKGHYQWRSSIWL